MNSFVAKIDGGLLRLANSARGERVIDLTTGELHGDIRSALAMPNQVERVHLSALMQSRLAGGAPSPGRGADRVRQRHMRTYRCHGIRQKLSGLVTSPASGRSM